ncbi:uncharacterized protein LOC105792095 isoform X3 [Gossypium raimondii]|uniref:uncharacterized protein LOC105792095 isoform X3 n=1 Tax=Gossypium raimondii TaxID=29730 RepID=UPI00227C1E17|nr:uncharacterized protein LOC105792095 isoform X3 [Gossypium raimondii]
MSYLAIFFLLYLSLHACNAHRLGFSAKENGNHVDFLASKDANKLKGHKLEMGPSISKKLQTPELQEVRSHGRRIIGAKTMKQTISDSFLAKEAVQNAISGYGIMSSSRVDLQSKETVEVKKKKEETISLEPRFTCQDRTQKSDGMEESKSKVDVGKFRCWG